ncbi:MAG: pseudouridine synthase [Bacteroidia bacterium]|nr:pseudouridine synthase [Bacteroidia bacterium]
MSYRDKLQYLLVKKLSISNAQAKEIILSNMVLVNAENVCDNIEILETDTVLYKNEIVQAGKKLIYVALYKPRGIECTLNEKIDQNLSTVFNFSEKLFPVGRLDKESEGLLILTNDGYYFNKTINPASEVEKEYIVTVNKPITQEFITAMSKGVEILGQITLPCKTEIQDEFTFKIILVQGLNRQIRRMCFKLNYMVTSLKRVRIGKILLENLQPKEFRMVDLEMKVSTNSLNP